MLRSLPSAIDEAPDTLYEPNAFFSQFLGSAINSMTFFSLFLSLLHLVLSFLAFLVVSFLSFSFSFFRFLVFSFLSFIFSSFLCFFHLTCVCRAYAQ